MRAALFLTLFLTTLPAWAADPNPEPPSPPAITWEVWGYKWDGSQYVVQPDHCLKTTDLKQAADYEAEIARFQNWTARSNIPALCSKVPANQSNSGYSRGNYSRSYNSRYDSRDLFGRPANYKDQFNAGATNFWVQPPNPD